MIPLLLVNNKFISDFCVKANLFNDFFSPICMPVNNESILNSLRVIQNDILMIIKTLDAEKAYGWDNISLKLIPICSDHIALPLMLVFETALKEKKFLDIWKKSKVVPVRKKAENNLLKNNCPISLLPIFKYLKG